MNAQIASAGFLLVTTSQDGFYGAPLPPPDFSFSDSPTAISITAGGSSGTSTITLASLNGFSGTVHLSTSTLPTGVSAMFVPNPVSQSTTAVSTLTVFEASTVVAGTFTLTVTGTSGTLSHSAGTITVTVLAGATPSFTLHWKHHISLTVDANVQTFHGSVANPATNNILAVIEIKGGSVTNPGLTFDFICGNGCVTAGSTIPSTLPVSVGAGLSATYSGDASFVGFSDNKVSFTGTLEIGINAAGPFTPTTATKSGSFAVAP